MSTNRTKKKIYLAGPMTGIPRFNFPKFKTAAYTLRRKGFFVFSPAEHDKKVHGDAEWMLDEYGDTVKAEQNGFNLREALHADLSFICQKADAIAMLPGWEYSRGATAEHATAVALGLEVMYLA